MLRMAFRNLKRNRRRTVLTISAIVIGIIFSTLILAWVNGAGAMMVEEGKRISGDIRLTAKDFILKEKALDTSSNISFTETKKLTKDISGKKVGRIKFGSLMFFNDEDEKALGFGIEKEDYDIVGFKKFINEGRFLDFNKNNEIIVGKKLKDKLGLKLGDEVTVLTSTQYKSTYALNYKVVGFFAMDNSNLNRTFYISLKNAMFHLDMEDRVTEFLIFLDKPQELEKNLDVLKQNKDYLTMGWNEVGLNALLSGVLPIMKFIFVIAFTILAGVGITNTMMMIVYERRYEIGVLKAQGLRNSKILKLFVLEGTLMGAIGSSLGITLGGTIAYYFSKRGIDLGGVLKNLGDNINVKSVIYMDFSMEILLYPLLAGIIISIITTLIAVIPELKLEAVKNLRGE